ncbi:MAG: hypothetical protein WC966_00265 [Bradymonadales bacterium]
MDKLQVIQLAAEKGGPERRQVLEKLMVYARGKGCQVDAGGGRVGGINIRFGSIGYAILDISTEGDVKLYAQPHPTKAAPEELSQKINDFLAENGEQLKLKSFPINCHGLLVPKAEEIPLDALIGFLEFSLQCIMETYYS